MTSPYPYTPRSSSSSSYSFHSPSWSPSSSSWPSDNGPPSSSPPRSPISRNDQHAYTTISSPTSYFSYMNARYDRSIGHERELQRELERERGTYDSYGYGKGKSVDREPEIRYNTSPTPQRQALPSFHELFGDIKPLSLEPPRTAYSSSSSTSSSLSSYSLSPPVSRAGNPRSSQYDSPTKQFVNHLSEEVFYSSDEEEETNRLQSRRRLFRYQPSLTERSFSDEEEEEDTQNTFTFSPERRRSTTFETSSERGHWTDHSPFKHTQPHKRSSEPAIALSVSFPSTLQSFHNSARHVSEPVPEAGTFRHDGSFLGAGSDESTLQDPALPHRYEGSLPSSSPPQSPISSIMPLSEFPTTFSEEESPSLADPAAHYRSATPSKDMVTQTQDIVMGSEENDISHEVDRNLRADEGKEEHEEGMAVVSHAIEVNDAKEGISDSNCLPACSPPSPELPHLSPLTSAASSRRTTPSLDDLIYAMETEEAAAAIPADISGEEAAESKGTGEVQPHDEISPEEEISLPQPTPSQPIAESSVDTPTAIVTVDTANSTTTPTSTTSTSISTTALTTSKAAHTNGGQKRPSPAVSSRDAPPKKRSRIDGSDAALHKSANGADMDFFSTSHPHRSHHSNRPTALPPSPSTDRVRVKVVSKVLNVRPLNNRAVRGKTFLGEKKKVENVAVKIEVKEKERVVPSKPKDIERLKVKAIEDVDMEDGATLRSKRKPSVVEPQHKPKPPQPKASSSLHQPKSATTSTTSPSKPPSHARSKMIIESDSESEEEEKPVAKPTTTTFNRGVSSPLSSPVSSDAEEEDDESDNDSEEEEDSEDEKPVRRKTPVKRRPGRPRKSPVKPPSSSRSSKPLSKKPLTPLHPRDAEIVGLLIETMAQSRASSHTVSILYRSIQQSWPGILTRLAEDQEGVTEIKGKGKTGETEWWLHELVRVMELGMRRTGMFGRVESSGKDSSDRPLEAHYFYVPERDEDQERAALIKSIMPRAGKRTETTKYKQYYWKPVEGKRLRYDAVDGI